MDIRPTIIISILILVTVIALSFLLSNRMRLLKYCCWIVGFLIFVFIVILNPINVYKNKQEQKSLIGTYQLEINKSKYHDVDLVFYKALSLNVKANNTFTLSAKAPFLAETSGTWMYWLDGDQEIIKFKFNNSLIAFFIDSDKLNIILNKQLLVNASTGDKIIFKQETFSNK